MIGSKKTVIDSAAIGTGISLLLFLAGWWTGSFESLLLPQLPGFLASSWLWGYPGFPHESPNHMRGAFLFPFVMIGVDALFYAALFYAGSCVLKRSSAMK